VRFVRARQWETRRLLPWLAGFNIRQREAERERERKRGMLRFGVLRWAVLLSLLCLEGGGEVMRVFGVLVQTCP
jgi:hypothetical protein